MNNWREWLGAFAILGAMLLVMYVAIALGARLARRAIGWADERDRAERSENSSG